MSRSGPTGPSALAAQPAEGEAGNNKSRPRDLRGPVAGGQFGDGLRIRKRIEMAIGPIAIRPLRPPVPWTPLVIAEERCKGCELCVAACPKSLLALGRGRVNVLGYHPVELTDKSACTSCAFCARVCPDSVFTVWAAPRSAPQERNR